ncbi:MAG TPA: hypothetical protein VJY62_02245 [Bacteroidia bacterium]|nr:hypothetical protein [Bacteroidia bacterium]
MKELNKYIDFVTSVSRNNSGVLQKIIGNDDSKKMFRLAHGFYDKSFENDAQAMQSLYGNQKKSASYRKLKSRLKDRLTDLIFLQDAARSMKFPVDRSLLQAQRKIYAAQTLIMRDQRNAALTLLKPAFYSSVHFNHTHLALQACRLLCTHYAIAGNKKKWNYFSSSFVELMALNTAEAEMHYLYCDTLVHIVHVIEYSREEQKMLRNSYIKAKKLYERFTSHFITIYYFRLAVYYYHSRLQFNKVIKLCKQGIAYLDAHPQFYQLTRAGEFLLMELESCLLLREFNRGRECVERLQLHFLPHSSPWVVFQAQYFLLAMRTGNYQEALEIFYKVNPQNRKLSKIQQERWHIYEAYLNFALPDKFIIKQFNIFRFLNDVPLTSRDKTGYNFSILVAQIILLVNMKETERLYDLKQSFRLYLYHYIKKNKHPRHYHFGRMLRFLFSYNFNPAKAAQKVKPYLINLQEQKKDKLNILEETEIIPYETLWVMLMNKFVTKKR